MQGRVSRLFFHQVHIHTTLQQIPDLFNVTTCSRKMQKKPVYFTWLGTRYMTAIIPNEILDTCGKRRNKSVLNSRSTRMHSSRMCTARSSNRLLVIGGGICLGACWEHPPGLGLDPLRSGPRDPPLARPPTSLQVWAWRPPHWPDPPTSPQVWT